MTFDLRYYQAEAVDAIWKAIRSGAQAPVACLPTGAGKTAVVAQLVKDALQWNGRVLILVHVKELVQQLALGIEKHCEGQVPLGVLSAGLGIKTINQVTVAGIQSSYRRATDLGPRDLIIIDECHLIPPNGEGMYQSLISDLKVINPNARVVGLTATPYRLSSGLIHGEGQMFEYMVYDAGVRRLMDDGFLSKLRGKNGGAPDLDGVHRRGGDFIIGELEACMSDEEKVNGAVDEMIRHGADRKAWLVFCCGVAHAHAVSKAMEERAGIVAPIITGDTPDDERDDRLKRFKDRELRSLVNVNVLTTGFDAPHVDLIVMLRPTESPGLYYQMVGRGLRTAPDKDDCLILDLAGNIERHGPIDQLNDRVVAKSTGEKNADAVAPQKSCPECEEVMHAAVAMCPACGYVWPKEEARHGIHASDASPVSQYEPPREEIVTGIEYQAWTKRGGTDADPQTLRVDYFNGYDRIASEWVCVEHEQGSFAFNKALTWLDGRLVDGVQIYYDGVMKIKQPCGSIHDIGAQTMADLAPVLLRTPTTVHLEKDGKFDRVIGYGWETVVDADDPPTPELLNAWDDLEDPPF